MGSILQEVNDYVDNRRIDYWTIFITPSITLLWEMVSKAFDISREKKRT